MFRFNKTYAVFFVSILIIEVLIVCYAKYETFSAFLYGFLFVALIYCLVLTFFDFNKLKTLIGVGLLAVTIEVFQSFGVFESLGWAHNKFTSGLFGPHFNPNDLLSYVGGCAIIYLLEKSRVS